MRGVVVGTGKRLTEVGQRLGRWFTTLLTSRDLQERKARFEEAQCVAHVGYWVWNLDTDRVTWSDETYRIYGLMPQNGPLDLGTIREMVQPEDRETVFRIAEAAILGRVRPDAEHRVVRPQRRSAHGAQPGRFEERRIGPALSNLWELNSREALAPVFCRSEQVCRHDALPRPEHHGAPLLRHIREGRRRMVVCGACCTLTGSRSEFCHDTD